MKHKTYIQLCPNCGSARFHQENDFSAIFGDRGFYVCDECNFSAKIFPEVDVDDIEKFRKELKKEKVSEKVKVGVRKVTGPLGVLAGVVVFAFLSAIAFFVGIVAVLAAAIIMAVLWVLSYRKK